MNFDLSDVGTTRAEEGVAMALINPRTRTPIMGEDNKTPVTITVLGRSSERFRTTLRAIQVARAKLAGLRQAMTEEELFDEDTNTLIACTVGWTIPALDGESFPFNAANSRRLWTDSRFLWLRERTLAFILDDGNFLPVGSTISSAMPGTNSA